VAQYAYQSISSEAPEIPILTVNLFLPGDNRSPKISCISILDTGSDCTLLPITLLMQARARPTQGLRKIPVCGIEVSAIPFFVGLTFGQYELPNIRIYGVGTEEIGTAGLIGRDILNQFKIDFNGPELTFEIQ
jgi:hypothetical protein